MATFRDFSGRNVLPIARFARPTSLHELRREVLQAEVDGLTAHAVGSAWAFSAPAYCEGVVIETDELSRFPEWPPGVVLPHPDPSKLHVAVEGGIKVHDLDLALLGRSRTDRRPGFAGLPAGKTYSLPTHGGAGGQGLAGAFTTGTHGGDVARPLIADYIRAAIVVGSGGVIRVVQRPQQPVLDFAQLLPLLEQELGPEAIVVDEQSPDALDAILVSVGRFGVIYAVVVEVHDETPFQVLELRRKKLWSEVEQELRAGTGVAAAQAADDFLQVVISPVRQGNDRQCYETIHRRVPGARIATAGEEFGLGPIASRSVVAERANAALLPALVGQAFCADHITPELQTARDVLLAAGTVMAVQFPPFGAIAAIPLFEAAASIARTGPDHRLGDVLADVFNLFTRSGFPQVLEGANAALLDGGQSDRLPPPPPDPAFRPWLVHGSRSEIADFQDYGVDCYRGDSVELFFAADNVLPDKVNEIIGVFELMRARGVPIGAYISLRFLAASDALLGVTASSPSCAVEISMLRGLEGNREALNRLQDVARTNDGRVHWGQQNDLTPDDVAQAYGDRLARWKRKLGEFEGESITFSTPFTRARDLEPERVDAWAGWSESGITPRSGLGVVSAGGGMPLEVFAIDDTRTVNAGRRPANGPESWRQISAQQVDETATPVPIRVHDGRIELFLRWDDRIKHCWEEGRPGGPFSAWDEKGSFPGRGPIIDGNPAVAEHLDRRLECFALEREPPHRMLHTFQHGGILGGTWSAVFTRTDRSVGGSPSGCVRSHTRSGGATDQMIVVSIAPRDDVAGVAFGTVVYSAQRGPASDSGWNDWAVLAPPDGAGFIAAGGGGSPIAVNVTGPGMRPHVLAISDRGQVHEAVDDDNVTAIGWEPWRPLPPLPPTRRLDTSSRLATVQNQTLWLFGLAISGQVMAIEFVPGTGWQQWIDLGGNGTGNVAAGNLDDGRIEVLVKPRGRGGLRTRRQNPDGQW
jgi:hypothetical protein